MREKQVVENKKTAELEKEADQRQLEIFQKQHEDGTEEDKQKAEKARKARQDLDVALIGQIRESMPVHPLRFGTTQKIRQTELAYNRLLFEQMSKMGFRKEHTDSMLGMATDKGKIEYFGSVGRSDEPIHALEEQVLDV